MLTTFIALLLHKSQKPSEAMMKESEEIKFIPDTITQCKPIRDWSQEISRLA